MDTKLRRAFFDLATGFCLLRFRQRSRLAAFGPQTRQVLLIPLQVPTADSLAFTDSFLNKAYRIPCSSLLLSDSRQENQRLADLPKSCFSQCSCYLFQLLLRLPKIMNIAQLEPADPAVCPGIGGLSGIFALLKQHDRLFKIGRSPRSVESM